MTTTKEIEEALRDARRIINVSEGFPHQSDWDGFHSKLARALLACHERAEKAEKGMYYLNAALNTSAEESEKFADKLKRAYDESRQLRAEVEPLRATNKMLASEVERLKHENARMEILIKCADELITNENAKKDWEDVKRTRVM